MTEQDSPKATRRDSSRGMTVLRTAASIATTLAMHGFFGHDSGSSVQNNNPTPSTTETTTPYAGDYVTYLQQYLATGVCKIEVGVAFADELASAVAYTDGNDHPTNACPNPQVSTGVVDIDQYNTGDVLGNGATLIVVG